LFELFGGKIFPYVTHYKSVNQLFERSYSRYPLKNCHFKSPIFLNFFHCLLTAVNETKVKISVLGDGTAIDYGKVKEAIYNIKS
jgi:hypothetical protein